MSNIKEPLHNYESILPRGKSNAVSSSALAEMLGFRSVRDLQKDIEQAREAGQLILSASTGGYYLPATDREVEEFVKVLKSRALNTLRTIKHARRYLNRTQGQACFSECADGQLKFETEGR